MPDYGHDLIFGTFLTPAASGPAAGRRARPAHRARRARPGDLPGPPVPAGVPRHLDPADVGRRPTERVRVAGNVLNLPLRPPAVLARAAASLDLLSGGRFELGLGAGAFWDAIEAMGGAAAARRARASTRSTRRSTSSAASGTPTSAAACASTASTTGRRRQARPGAGARHRDLARRVQAADAALIGRKADGWLPSLGYLQPGDLAPGNATIDEAAQAAGRDPREIRRLLNIGSGSFSGAGFLQGPAEQWVEELLPLVLEHGFSTFILASDDPRAIERLRRGGRARAARGRRGRARARPGRRPARRAAAARWPGARRHRLRRAARVAGRERGRARRPELRQVRSTYMRAGSPGLVLRPGRRRGRRRRARVRARAGRAALGAQRRARHQRPLDQRRRDRHRPRRADTVEVLDRAQRRVRLGAGRALGRRRGRRSRRTGWR